jgi:hypothetical protein
MQATTRFHDGVPTPLLQEADVVVPDSVTLHATTRVFTPHADGRDSTMGRLLRRDELPARGCVLGVDDRDAWQANSLHALLLRQATAGGQPLACPFGHALRRGFPCTGVAQEAHGTGLLDHEEVFARVTRLRAAVMFWWLFGIGRAVERPFRAIMPTRGRLELPSAACVANLAAHAAAVRAGSRSWSAKA